MTDQIVRVPTKPRVHVTEALRSLAVGETLKFPVGTNYGSIRTLATVNGIRVHLKMLETGQIEVTRRPDKPRVAKAKTEKLYDL